MSNWVKTYRRFVQAVGVASYAVAADCIEHRFVALVDGDEYCYADYTHKLLSFSVAFLNFTQSRKDEVIEEKKDRLYVTYKTPTSFVYEFVFKGMKFLPTHKPVEICVTEEIFFNTYTNKMSRLVMLTDLSTLLGLV